MMVLGEQLEFDFEFGCPSIEAEYYRDGAEDLLHRLVPADLLEEGGVHLSAKRARFNDILPLISWSELNKAPCTLSVLMLCKYRLNACNFFNEMISRWLLPNKRINVELFFASDVRLPHLSDDLLSVAEVVIYLKSAADVEEVRRNLHAIETEIRLGVVSHYHARRILEFKGLSSDGKTAMIQERISSLIQSHSKDFDTGIFSQMQQFLVTCPENFKKIRDYHHISRIISNLHSLRKVLKQNRDTMPTKRHVILKFLKTQLKMERKERSVLGILMGVNFLAEHEIFETNHLISAIQKYVPQAKLVPESAFADRISDASQQTIYLEVEKSNGLDFSMEEIQKLRSDLPDGIKSHVEHLTRPIFMPRNDEEVLRNIMALSRQIRFVHDQSQVNISYDEQNGENLFFTVILVRLVDEEDFSAQQVFANGRSPLKYIPDRVRKLGLVRKKVKEATVFRTSLPVSDFLRDDHSVDLYLARSQILKELHRLFGDVRDYNGGMIFKQIEQINALKAALGKIGEMHPILVEKFFYSLSPMEMRTSLDTESMKQLFMLLLQSMKPGSRKKDSEWYLKQDPKKVLAVLPKSDQTERKRIAERLEKMAIPMHQLVFFSMEIEEVFYAGYLFINEEKEKQESFLAALSHDLF